MKAIACLLIVAVLVLVSPTSASGCFQNCTANSDCDDAHCSLCVDGGCQFGNASSSGSADSGSSGPDTCGQPCSNGNCTGYCSHCGLDGYCRHRRNDQPQCGTGCADDSDCALAGDCTDCHGGSCSAPPSRGGSSSDGGDCPSLECDCPEDCQDGRSGSCTECSVRTARCELPRAGMITLKAVPKSVRDTGVTAARAVFGTQSRAMCNGECDCPEMCGGYCGVCDGSIGRCVPQGRAKAPVQRKLAKR